MLGNNMYAYCGNNPSNFQDPTGYCKNTFSIYFKVDCGNWQCPTSSVHYALENAVDKLSDFCKNEDEQVVLNSKYFSFYKGVPVIRTNGNRSGYFGAIFLTRGTNVIKHPEDMLRHEYGHSRQAKVLGPINYALYIFVPSWLEFGTNDNYYEREVEITADILGGVESRRHKFFDAMDGFLYLYGCEYLGLYAWDTID